MSEEIPCLECHFEWEEQTLLPFLPAPIFKSLLHQHKDLQAHLILRPEGPTKTEIERHARWEEDAFKRYLPKHIYTELCEQHRLIKTTL